MIMSICIMMLTISWTSVTSDEPVTTSNVPESGHPAIDIHVLSEHDVVGSNTAHVQTSAAAHDLLPLFPSIILLLK